MSEKQHEKEKELSPKEMKEIKGGEARAALQTKLPVGRMEEEAK